jgi:hypothetical protein
MLSHAAFAGFNGHSEWGYLTWGFTPELYAVVRSADSENSTTKAKFEIPNLACEKFSKRALSSLYQIFFANCR